MDILPFHIVLKIHAGELVAVEVEHRKAGDFENIELLRKNSSTQLIDVNTNQDELPEEVSGRKV